MSSENRGIQTIKVTDGQVILRLSKQLYEKEAVFSTLYRFEKVCVLRMEPVDETHIEVRLSSKVGDVTSDKELSEMAGEFCNELIDQQVRRDLDLRFGKLRELIVEHAFSPIKNLEQRISKNE